ncbi:hypothetical protein BE61_68210 [Bradyrhizobium elkanii USDA 61]|nr:hypothetical protein BE61_68210 [Bradyrhizobium elkanii USDA 61]GEC54320.1 hypothetical protein BEL01nite_33630 [Bradyrhizobium elkanii]
MSIGDHARIGGANRAAAPEGGPGQIGAWRAPPVIRSTIPAASGILRSGIKSRLTASEKSGANS